MELVTENKALLNVTEPLSPSMPHASQHLELSPKPVTLRKRKLEVSLPLREIEGHTYPSEHVGELWEGGN